LLSQIKQIIFSIWALLVFVFEAPFVVFSGTIGFWLWGFIGGLIATYLLGGREHEFWMIHVAL